jgi:hypothetical protein
MQKLSMQKLAAVTFCLQTLMFQASALEGDEFSASLYLWVLHVLLLVCCNDLDFIC